MNPHDISKAILSSDLDEDDLRIIGEALRLKIGRVRKARVGKLQLQVGDLVRFQGIRPKYMNGVEARITRIRQTKAECDITGPTLFRGSRSIVVPMTALARVDS